MANLLQKLAMALGKSEDEIAEALAKKASKATESVSEKAILKNLSKEAADVRQPIGSGKNLEALQRAASEAPDQSSKAIKELTEKSKNTPFVDTERNISFPVSEYGDEVGGAYKVPKQESYPLVLSKAQKQEAVPAVFKNIKSEDITEEAKKRMNPKLLKILGAAGLIGGGAAMMGGGDETPVQVPFERGQEPKAPILPDNYMQLAQDEANSMDDEDTVKTEAPKKDGVSTESSKKLSEPSRSPADTEFQDASDMADRNALLASLGKAASMVGGGIATLGSGQDIKVDGSAFDDLLKRADVPLTRLKEKQAHKKAKDELNDEDAMRDPNSEVSKTVSALAIKTGLIKPGQKVSAMTLKNAGVNLGTLLSTIEAGNARRDAAALAKDLRSSEKESAREFKAEEDRKKREDKRKLVTEEIEARKRTIGDNIKRARDLIKKYGTVESTGPEAELLQGMLDEIAIDTAKLQDPDSVARPAEVQLVRQSLVPEDTLGRMTMTNKTADEILSQFEKRINERATTGYKVRGIEQPTDRDNNSGGMVKIIPPGGSKPKLIPADQAQAAIAAGGKLVE